MSIIQNMSTFVCEYCNSKLASLVNLKIHKKKTKKCLEIQKQMGLSNSLEMFECQYCEKTFNYKTSLKKHYDICSEKINY